MQGAFDCAQGFHTQARNGLEWATRADHLITRSAYSGCLVMYSRTKGQMTSTL